MALLEIQTSRSTFPTHSGVARAVDDVTLSVDKGGYLASSAESGCGKSITSLSILRLVHTRTHRLWQNPPRWSRPFTTTRVKMRAVRGNRIALIPQDPMTSLNPVYTIGAQIIEAIEHQKLGHKAARQKAIEVLESVRIPEAKSRVDDYPHQL